MDYTALVSSLIGMDAKDVQATERLLQLVRELSEDSTRQILENIRDLDKLISNINRLDTAVLPHDNMSQRKRFIDRVERLSECERIELPLKGKEYPEPYFQRFDFILCHFGGVGWEYDGPHFAMVWLDDHFTTEIVVIPTTSQFTKELETEFSVGIIEGLPRKNTILSVDRMVRISRKRVIYYNERFVRGRLHLKLHPIVQERVEYALALWLHKEKSLGYYIRNETGAALPVDFLTHFQTIRFMPVRDVNWDSKNRTLYYRKWNESSFRQLAMKFPNTFIKTSHKKYALYDPIFSPDTSRRDAAIAEFERLYSD